MRNPYRIRFAKFLVGGALYFLVGYLVLVILYGGFHTSWWVAKLTGDVIGWTLNYLVQRYWAFATPKLKLHEYTHVSRYVVINIVNVAIDYAIVGGLRARGISPFIGYFVSAAFFTGWNFLWFRYWVFADSPVPRLRSVK
jgi:putative flippase GtrA